MDTGNEEPTFNQWRLNITPNNGQGSSPTTNAEGTNNKAKTVTSALVSIASASGNNQTTYNKCTAVNGMNRVNMILLEIKFVVQLMVQMYLMQEQQMHLKMRLFHR